MNDTTITITRLLTDKQALNHSRIDTQAMPLPLAHGEALGHFLRDTGLPGPAPKFFFAPVQIKKRNADWGHVVFLGN